MADNRSNKRQPFQNNSGGRVAISAYLTSFYTLTPLHCGTGQTSGAVDLPISRESHTDLPVLPAASIKGMARSRAVLTQVLVKTEVSRIFGPDLEKRADEHETGKNDTDGQDDAQEGGLRAGTITFTEGKCLLYPVRGVSRPFHYVTCPLLLERLLRDSLALAVVPMSGVREAMNLELDSGGAWVSDPGAANKPLVLEDLLFEGAKVQHHTAIVTLATSLVDLIPRREVATQKRLKNDLVIISDADFLQMIQHCIPVQARIKLGENKTTSDNGNLWYEEFLPSDCVFTSFILARPDSGEMARADLEAFIANLGKTGDGAGSEASPLGFIQLGGNETVGQGLCWWTQFEAQSPEESTSDAAGGGSSSSPRAGSVTRAAVGAASPSSHQRMASSSRNSDPSRSHARSLLRDRQTFSWNELAPKMGQLRWKDLVRDLKGLPVQMRQQGLAVTVADLMRREKTSAEIAHILARWTLNRAPVNPLGRVEESEAKGRNLLQKAIEAERAPYLAAQSECLATLEQLKSIAVALDARES